MTQIDPAILFNARGTAPLLLICEHASNVIPPDYGTLGLAQEHLTRHIAYDPGALDVAKGLAMRLNAPLVHASVSRLVIDLNRNPDDFDAMPEIGETTPILGNQALTGEERSARAQRFYHPFHDRLAAEIAGRPGLQALISIHSFTPIFKDVSRPWHVGIIHNDDDRLSKAILARLLHDRAIPGGLNVPYAPSDRVFHTLGRHSTANGLGRTLQTAMIELRNDLISEPIGQEIWIGRLAQAIGGALDCHN